MRRDELEHVIAAAANIVDLEEFVIIGSQAVLGTHPFAPAELLRSMEVDLYPAQDPDRAIEIEGVLGDGSGFHEAYGYYAHAVAPNTPSAPAGWQGRLVRVVIPPRVGSDRHPVGLFMELHDLVLAKCVAGRDKDWTYARVALEAGLVDRTVLRERMSLLDLTPDRRHHITTMLTAILHDPPSAETPRKPVTRDGRPTNTGKSPSPPHPISPGAASRSARPRIGSEWNPSAEDRGDLSR